MGKHKNLLAGGMAAIVLALAIGVTLPLADIFAADIEILDIQAENSAVYNEAVASIAKYNKLEALQAAVKSVQEQEPVAVALWDIDFGIPEVEGQLPGTANYRTFSGFVGGGGQAIWFFLALDIAKVDGVIPSDKEDDTNWVVDTVYETYKDKTFRQLLEIAKSNSKYSGFQEETEAFESVYLRGEKALRDGLAVLAPGLEGLNLKNGDELVEIYHELNYPVPGDPMNDLVSAYMASYALSNLAQYEESVEDPVFEITDAMLAQYYGRLVETAKVVDPNFEVNLSGVALLEPETGVQPEQNLPTLPNTGADNGEDVSATVVKVATVGAVGVVTMIGIATIAKRFLFSPLKRKR